MKKPADFGPGIKDPSWEIVTISPELASAWLDLRAKHQRTIFPGRVGYYLRLMREDQFYEAHQSFSVIAFDSAGRLINGQHRLLALSKQSNSYRLHVLRNIDPPPGFPVAEGDQPHDRADHFLLGESKYLLQLVKLWHEISVSRRDKIPLRLQAEIADFLRDAHLAISANMHAATTGSVGYRLGFVYAWLEANEDHRKGIERQWSAFNLRDFPNMWPSIATLIKTIFDEIARAGGVNAGSAYRKQATLRAIYALRKPNAKRMPTESALALIEKELASNFPVEI